MSCPQTGQSRHRALPGRRRWREALARAGGSQATVGEASGPRDLRKKACDGRKGERTLSRGSLRQRSSGAASCVHTGPDLGPLAATEDFLRDPPRTAFSPASTVSGITGHSPPATSQSRSFPESLRGSKEPAPPPCAARPLVPPSLSPASLLCHLLSLDSFISLPSQNVSSMRELTPTCFIGLMSRRTMNTSLNGRIDHVISAPPSPTLKRETPWFSVREPRRPPQAVQ